MKLKKKTIISFISMFIGVLVLMWGCSADPMVAPVKVFIVGTGNDRGRVLYDDDYNARVIFLKVGEASVVKVVTNRFEEPKDLVWNSNTPSVATVTKKEGLEGLIRATGYGASMISVTLNSKESDAYSYGKGTCYVIVNDMAQDDGINIKFTNMLGIVKSDTDKYEVEAPTLLALNDKHLSLLYDNTHNLAIGKVEWYVNGVLKSTSPTFDMSFESFGCHPVDCIVYREINGTNVPIGTSSIEILANNI